MVTLVILDGFGINKSRFGNAIKACGTPYLKKLKKKYPFATLFASGSAVGLPDGQMGNSEVGHLTLGAGRVVLQDLALINRAISDGSFFERPNLVNAINHAIKNNSSLHIMGLVSDGGVHSHIEHLYAILSLANDMGLKKIFVHAFTDGRDTGVTSAQYYLQELEDEMPKSAKIASVCGRVYAMDREQRYDRVQKAYELLTQAKGNQFSSATEAVKSFYDKGITDEYMEPCIIDKNAVIKDGDSVIFFNYRSDRAREISFAFTDPNFSHFKTKKWKNLLFTTMQQYDDKLVNAKTIFPPEVIEDNLSALISKAGLKQFHIAETTKYAHVTFFFNGTIEKPYKGEDRNQLKRLTLRHIQTCEQLKSAPKHLTQSHQTNMILF